VIESINRPLSPQEILTAARERVSGMGIATVYRALKEFEQSGVLKAVNVPGEGARYEMAGKEHHHHFQCTACSRMFEIHGCPGNFSKLIPKGFKLESHEILLYGSCKECSRQ